MNICIFNHYASPPDRPVGTRHYDFGRRLVQRGHVVTIFAAGFNHWTRREDRLRVGEFLREELFDGVTFIWVRTFPYQDNSVGRFGNMVSYSWNVLRASRGMERPDVVVGSSVHPLAGLAASVLAKRWGIPFVFEVRDLWPQTLVDMGVLSPYHPLTVFLRALQWFLYRRAERIITLLPLSQNYIAKHGGKDKAIAWIPNGVDLNRFPVVEREELACDPVGFTVMYLGAHGKANALDVVVNAAERLQKTLSTDGVRIVFVGNGPEKVRLVSEAQRLGLMNVEFRPTVPKEQVALTLREADALVASTNEIGVYRFGISFNKLFDYMAASRPILFAGQIPCNPVEESGAGFVIPPNDPVTMAETILRLSRMSSEERQTMGQKGRAYVERNHNIDSLAEHFLDCLAEAVQVYETRIGR